MGSSEHSSHRSRKNERGQSEQITYPVNLKVKDFYYFLLAPTLHYHLNFPRNSGCRHSYVIKSLLEVIFLFHLMLVLFQQILPNIYVSVKLIKETASALLTEYVLKLAERRLTLAVVVQVVPSPQMTGQIQLSSMWKWLSDSCYSNMRVWDQPGPGPSSNGAAVLPGLLHPPLPEGLSLETDCPLTCPEPTFSLLSALLSTLNIPDNIIPGLKYLILSMEETTEAVKLSSGYREKKQDLQVGVCPD